MLEQIKRDKWKHFIVGVAMGLLFEALLLWLFPALAIVGSVIIFIIIVIISYAFELTSLIIKRGHYDILDAVAGAVGGAVGMAIVLLARSFL